MHFDLKTYLARIRLAHVEPTIDGLRRLHDAQLRAIPFENIEPFTGVVPALAPESVFRKLVTEKRGGYCFELNGLFGNALKALGFETEPVMGRMRFGAPRGGPRAHLAWIVSLDGEEWLADVSFGGSGPRYPVRLVPDLVQNEGADAFRLVADTATGELVLERLEPQGWFALYGFDRYPVVESDVEAGNFLAATWREKAPFSDNLVLTIRMAEGRASLFNKAATVIDAAGRPEQWVLGSLTELQTVLKDLFRLDPDRSMAEMLWSKLEASDLAKAA